MATRRPKVPKVAPARSAKDVSGDADVIRADFGPGKDTTSAKAPSESARAPKATPPAGSREPHGRKDAGLPARRPCGRAVPGVLPVMRLTAHRRIPVVSPRSRSPCPGRSLRG